jgi:pyruvate/2-oxoglutarate dehydrogenase complex dihydrolipoamide acyltransferase (E2) component
MKEVKLTQWGMGMREGTILRWLHAVGDLVKEGDELVEVEAEKITDTICAPVSGVLREIRVAEGQSVPVRSVLALIEAEE